MSERHAGEPLGSPMDSESRSVLLKIKRASYLVSWLFLFCSERYLKFVSRFKLGVILSRSSSALKPG